jgi:hypothetical protein
VPEGQPHDPGDPADVLASVQEQHQVQGFLATAARKTVVLVVFLLELVDLLEQLLEVGHLDVMTDLELSARPEITEHDSLQVQNLLLTG